MNPLDGKAVAHYARSVLLGNSEEVKLPSFDARVVVRLVLRGVTKARGDSIKSMDLKSALEIACRTALEDGPLQDKELKAGNVEVSIITSSSPMEEAPRPTELDGKGILVETLDGAGCVLPQEIKESGFLPKQALNAACQNAGLSFRAWQDPDARLALFTAEVYLD
jgi:AMMECR1 domain-containing protein